MTAKTKRKPKHQTVTLHIGEHKIKGLKASKSVVAQLKRHALDAQLASVGQKLAWTELQPEPPPAVPPIYRPPYKHEAVGTDMTRRDPPAWLMWWHLWRFRRSLKRATLEGHSALPGWRRRCLNVVKNWRGPTRPFEPILPAECPKSERVVRESSARITRLVRPVIHFWRQTTGAWLDDPA